MRDKILSILLIGIFALIQTSCSNDSIKANALFGDVNKYITKYGDIENTEINPLRAEINKAEGSKSGAKKSLVCVHKILNKVDNQFKLLGKAKTKLSNILALNVNNDISTYAKLTDNALMADMDILNASKKLYSNLKNMYLLASQNNLSQKEYEKISQDVRSLTDSVATLEQVRKKRYQKRDFFYKNHLGK